MNVKKNAVVLLLIVCMLFGLVGCTAPATPSNTPSEATPAPSADAKTDDPGAAQPNPASDLDLSQHAEIVMLLMGDAPTDAQIVEDAINVKLNEMLNTSIDIQHTTWTDSSTKYANALTSASADMVYSANWNSYGTYANAGAFLELDDLLETYAPTLFARAEKSTLDQCRVGGELYAIPNLVNSYVSAGIMYREDLRAKYDLPVPDSIENMEAFFQGVKDNEPGQAILTPSSYGSNTGAGYSSVNALNIKYPQVIINGMPYGISANLNTPSEIYDYWNSQEFIDDCKLFKKWADAGFWTRSTLSEGGNTEDINNGLCVATVDALNPTKFINAQIAVAETHPDWELKYIAYGEISGGIYPAHATQNATSFVRGSKNPERAMAVLEALMMDEELTHLMQYGIEGTHYEIADGFYKNVSEKFLYEGFNSWGTRVQENMVMRQTDTIQQEMYAAYAEISAKNTYPNVNIGDGFSENYDAYQAERTAVSNVVAQYLSPLQAGLVDDVDAAVAEFLTNVNDAGLEVCRESYKQQWAAYCAEYGYDK